MKAIATDNSVRDMPQQARISGDKIVITSKVGRAVVEQYIIFTHEWEAAKRGPSANPEWNFAQLILKHTRHYDEQPGGPCQAQRIRDSQVSAIKKAFKKSSPSIKNTHQA
jgi:hypothetical protein